MKLSDFDFHLPEELIATRPAVPRSSARLLVADGAQNVDAVVTDLVDWLAPGDRLVLNDTRVIPARLSGVRARTSAQGDTEARIEVTLLEPRADGGWSALIKPLKKIKQGEVITFSNALSATLTGTGEGMGYLAFNLSGDDFDAALAEGNPERIAQLVEAGAALGIVAVIIRQELVLFIMGGVFVIETLSVIIQVASFKLRGKRVFKMAPIHHHFELSGWPEPRVIVRFWIITAMLVLFGLATLKLR